jgi:hypothetical protein
MIQTTGIVRTDTHRSRDLALRSSAAVCAIMSLAALVAHVFGVIAMPYSLTFVGVPSVLLLFALAALGRRLQADVFLNCLVVGLIGGFAATAAYDLSRLALRLGGVFQYDGLTAIYIFGSWITGTPTTTVASAVAGWIYHFWNGLSFGVFYTLTFGRAHWLYGVAYGTVMELMMLGLFPFFVRVSNQFDFIALSMAGHLVYGAVLGAIAQRYARGWYDAQAFAGRRRR